MTIDGIDYRLNDKRIITEFEGWVCLDPLSDGGEEIDATPPPRRENHRRANQASAASNTLEGI